jgi:hypothetical protein
MSQAGWRDLGLERYETTFRENDVDAELLPNLTADDLKEIGIASFGHRRQLLEAIAALRRQSAQAIDGRPARTSTENAPSPKTAAERRPLSVMLCDLIGPGTDAPSGRPADRLKRATALRNVPAQIDRR